VLDAACGQLGPLSPRLGFTVLCVQSSSQGSLFTVSLGRLASSLNLNSTVSVHGFSHSILMPVWFLSHLCRFSFYNYTWSSMLGVSMNAREVATHPHRNTISLLVDSFLWLCRGYILSPSWQSNRFKIPLNHGLIPCQFCFFLSGAISTIQSRLLQIQCHTHVERS